jgi:hypothetical protein
MFQIEVGDTEIPIVSFFKKITAKIIHFLKHVGKAFLDLFNPREWKWPQWIFAGIFILILVLMILSSIASGLKGIWIYKKSIFVFLISVVILLYFLIIVVSYVSNVRVTTEYDIINKTLQYIQWFIALMFLGIIFSIILAPNGVNTLINPLIYMKDCILVIFVLSFISFCYNMILLVVIE